MAGPRRRCEWAERSPLMQAYHDREWGVPLYDDRKLFEFLVLEGMQAGLSWLTVLKKRENFRQAFDQFDPRKIARYKSAKVRALLQDAGIIRNRAKIEATIGNAQAFIALQGEAGGFQRFMWAFVDGRPIQGARKRLKDIPVTTSESDVMSRELKALGFRFVGSTICYAHMQATGMVNDHLTSCYRYPQVRRVRPRAM